MLDILDAAISSVISPFCSLPPRTASPSNASTASATGLSFRMSGNIVFSACLLAPGPVRALGPIQRALLPNVEEPREHEHHENQHFDEAEHVAIAAQIAENDY